MEMRVFKGDYGLRVRIQDNDMDQSTLPAENYRTSKPCYQTCLTVSLSSVGGDRTVADSLASTRDIQSSRLKPVP